MALHAPWRDQYMQDLSTESKRRGAVELRDFLSDYWAKPHEDEKNHVVVRTGEGATGGMVLLNKFPYASGHLMAALGEAQPRLLDYTPDQRAALWRLTEIATELVERTLEPQGVNVGINQGSAAGAGLPGHLHVHIVPRWGGDVNFMAVVGRVRVIPSALETMAQRYRDTWAAIG
jgi:ATP adenylyltransferase